MSQERIGAYRIVRPLGAGGMGEVFLAFDERLERLVALKRVRSDRAVDAVLRERLRREARAIARLNHPHIVQIFDILEENDGGTVLVMEYVEGRTLSGLLEDGPLPTGLAVRLGAQVASGLAAAHGAGLVHRDLKGSNVLVTPDGQAKILDFGLARALGPAADEALTRDGFIMGTFRSMAPEQARGEGVDDRSDLFSLGVLLYEMLTGVSPFSGRTVLETLRNVVEAQPRPVGALRPDLPAGLHRLVADLLQKDPAQRPRNAAQVAQTLEALSSPAELPWENTASTWAAPRERSRTAFEPAWRRGRRSRAAAAVLVMVLLAGAVAVLAARWTGARAAGPLRVAVLLPEQSGDPGEWLALAASGAELEIQRSLAGLEGVSPVDPSQTREIRGSAAEMARSVSADEALASTVEVRGTAGRISLRRLRAADGAVLWAERIEVPAAPEDALVLANALTAALRRAYPDHQPRQGFPDLQARAEDYAVFIQTKRRIDAGRSDWAPELDRLEEIGRRSPLLLDAHVTAASTALNLYGDTQNPSYLVRVREAVERSRAVSPAYPRLTIVEVRLAIEEGDWTRAEQALADLEALVPGDVLPLTERARLEERRGRLDDAIRYLRDAAERRPTWRHLLRLARLENSNGEVEAAWRTLKQAQALAPGNTWVLAQQGEMELLHGDLERARAVYEKLVAGEPQRSDLTNLGLVHLLQGDFDNAVARFREALALEPDHLIVMLNLADAQLARGRRADAERLYARVLDRLQEMERTAPLQPVERTRKAQCLARLSRPEEAVALALGAVQESPKDSEVTYQAALVLALAGEDTSARVLARKALGQGVEPRWFSIPGFERVRPALPL